MTRLYFKSLIGKIALSHRKDIALSTLAGLVRVGAALGFIGVCKHLIDIATGIAKGSIMVFAILMVGCVVIQLWCGSVSTMVENSSEIVTRNSLRRRLFMHVVKGDWMAASEYHSGDVVSRLNDDVTTVSNLICRDFPYALITLAQLAGAIVFLMILDVRLGALIVVIMPIAVIVSRIYGRKMKSLNAQLRSAESRLSVSVQEGVRNRTLIKALSGYEQTSMSHISISNTIRHLTMRRTRLSLYSKVTIQGAFACGYALAFLFGIYGLTTGAITFGMMTAFLQLVNQVQRPTLELSHIVPSIVRTMTAAERIWEILNIPAEKTGDQIEIDGEACISFEDVSYKYPKAESYAIRNLSCRFSPGSITAVLGKSGAGKTTMFRLLLGLISPTEGRLRISNAYVSHDVSEATRINFSYVPQGNSLVTGTIRDNLLMGNPSATDDEIHEALHAACADFVYSLPGGLDFRCEEDGIGLSEGQAQRIAIARGLIHPSSILLLDEPTSALDAATSGRLLWNLAERQKRKTIILITHSAEVANLCQHKINL